jgi:hypothetical protein
MAAKIKTEISVGVTCEILDALETAVEFSGIRASQFARIALVEKLVRENWMEHPAMRRLQKKAVPASEIKQAAAL